MIEKIVSGGQTGVDRAALDVAIELGIEYGGWCPKGRLAEDGTISEKYNELKETESEEYSERTIKNIQDSDGTLILVPQNLSEIKDGTNLTIQEVDRQNKPYLIINIYENFDLEEIKEWIVHNQIKNLNIAGPRESQSPGIYEATKKILTSNLNELISENHCMKP